MRHLRIVRRPAMLPPRIAPWFVGTALVMLPRIAAADFLESVVKPASIVLPSGPGSLQGLTDAPEVRAFSGQLHYSIPVEVPSGVAGSKPDLSLTYDGALGNSTLGVGWTLQVPHIRRSVRLGVPNYDDSDEFEIVGLEGMPRSRLVEVESGDDHSGDEYRVEGAGQRTRVMRDENVWLVLTGTGDKYYFGVTPQSRHIGPDDSRVAAWYVSNAISVNGHGVNYSYEVHERDIQLSSVTWGPLVSTEGADEESTGGDGISTAFSVDVVYEGRSDAQVSMRTGFSVRIARRVDRIDVTAFGTLLRTYDLEYDDTFAVSRLTGIVVTGVGGDGVLPPLAFEYVPSQPSDLFEVTGAGGWSLSDGNVTLADIDADGLADLVKLEWGEHRYRKNVGGVFGEETLISGVDAESLADGTARLMDVDGDKRLELVSSDAGGWYFHRYYGGAQWEPEEQWTGTQYVPLNGWSKLCDVNGDGQLDAVTSTFSGLSTRLGETSGFGDALPPDVNMTVSLSDLILADANGDGLCDAIEVGLSAYFVSLGRGDGTFSGRERLVFDWTHGANGHVEFLDANRDGLVDAIYVDASGQATWQARRADGTFAPGVAVGPPAEMVYGTVAFADINGNGSTDIVWSSSVDGSMWGADLSGGTKAGLLRSVSNGLGQVISVDYGSSGELSSSAHEREEPWALTLPTSVPVPIRVSRDTGETDGVRVVTYEVRDGFWDPWERRFAGFLSVRSEAVGSSGQQSLVSNTTFHAGIGMSRVLRGKVITVEREDGDGVIFDRTTTSWTTHRNRDVSLNVLVSIPVKNSETTEIFEGEAEAVEIRTVFENYDENGNPAVVLEHGRTDLEGDEIIARRMYANNDDRWVRGALIEEQIEDGSGNIVRRDQLFYDGDDVSGPLAWGDVDKGLLRRTERYDSEEDRWVLIAGNDYDGQGNPTRIYEDAYWRELQYDSNNLHPDTETVRPSAGEELSWTAKWNKVTGLVEAVTGPDGVTHRVQYDAVGRPLALSVDDFPAHTHYVYEWETPRPRTRSYSFNRSISSLIGREDETTPSDWTSARGWQRIDEIANGAGETLYKATWLGDEGRTWIVDDYRTRDVRGRVVSVSEPFYSATVDSLVIDLPEDGDAQRFEYDAVDRVTMRRLPTGAQQIVTYGKLSQTTTGMGLADATREFDGHGRVRILSRELDELTEKLNFAHDANGNITSVAIQDGAVIHQYDYDSMGRLRTVTTPDTGTTAFTYYDTGRRKTASNGAGQVVTYQYDEIGRLTAQDGDGKRIHEFHYDTARAECGESSAFRTAGRLAWALTPGTQELVYFGYDRFGRVGRVSRRVRGEWSSKWTRSSAFGLPLRVVTDDGLRVGMQYDAASRLVALGEYWQQLDADASGRSLSEQYGNGVLQTYARDDVGLPTDVSLTHASTLLYDVVATYNDWGGLETVEDMLPSFGLHNGASYTYDLAARVKSATVGTGDASPYEFTYKYDGLNNLTLRDMKSGPALPQNMASGVYLYGENGFGPRQLTGVVELRETEEGAGRLLDLEYDGAGRTTREGDRWLEYDALDRLRRVTVPDAGGSGFVRYEYGHDGLRSYVDDPLGTDERWFSDSHQQVGASVRYHYLKLGERLIARIERVRDEACTEGGRGPTIRPECNVWHAGSVQYAHASVTSGPVVLTDGLGAIVEERRYEPFGSPINADHALEVHGWSDKPYDLTTGYVYHGARWRSTLGTRWLTSDPLLLTGAQLCIESPGECHPYGFARNNSVSFVDPTGMAGELVPLRHAEANAQWAAENPDKVPYVLAGTAGLAAAGLAAPAVVNAGASAASSPAVTSATAGGVSLLRRFQGTVQRWGNTIAAQSQRAWHTARFAVDRFRNPTAASVHDKLTRYLLNPEHPVGKTKAAWFERALGFTQQNSAQLARQIVFDPAQAVQTAVTQHGTKFNQVISIVGANKKTIDVTFAWIRNNDNVVRLVTSIPTKK